MKSGIYIAVLSLLVFISCKSDNGLVYDYLVQINKPTTVDKHLGDLLPIEIYYESRTGEEVHHINITIYNKITHQIVYDKPHDPHLDVPVSYTFTDNFTLSSANGLAEGDWVLEAKVWGHEDGAEVTSETIEFHILP
jgi:hypothetical protein